MFLWFGNARGNLKIKSTNISQTLVRKKTGQVVKQHDGDTREALGLSRLVAHLAAEPGCSLKHLHHRD